MAFIEQEANEKAEEIDAKVECLFSLFTLWSVWTMHYVFK